MPQPPYNDHTYDIDQAIRRSQTQWTYQSSRTDCEGAFLDRALLAREVVRLRGELAVLHDELTETQSTLTVAEVEVDHLTDQLNEEQPYS